jgi:hypothetical protein
MKRAFDKILMEISGKVTVELVKECYIHVLNFVTGTHFLNLRGIGVASHIFQRRRASSNGVQQRLA